MRMLKEKVEVLTTEIRNIRLSLDGLFEQESLCPMCGAKIVREDPMAPVRCACGWVWS